MAAHSVKRRGSSRVQRGFSGSGVRSTLLLAALIMFTGLATDAPAKANKVEILGRDWSTALTQAPDPQAGISFPYSRCFKRAAKRHDLPEALLLAIARGESDFNPRAVSHANAIGMMQILWPQTARHLGIHRRTALYDPCTNIDAGSRYLKELLQHYQGKVHLALAAYNYGPGRIRVNAQRIPNGAAWYSRYILRHYGYVTGAGTGAAKAAKRRPSPGKPQPYGKERKLEILRFDRPYRAQAFIDSLKVRAPELRLDWFRLPDYHYKVVALYHSDEQLATIRSRLRHAGIRLSR